MKKLGVITIGEAPREDIQPVFEQYLRNTDNILQVGVLDRRHNNPLLTNTQ